MLHKGFYTSPMHAYTAYLWVFCVSVNIFQQRVPFSQPEMRPPYYICTWQALVTTWLAKARVIFRSVFIWAIMETFPMIQVSDEKRLRYGNTVTISGISLSILNNVVRLEKTYP